MMLKFRGKYDGVNDASVIEAMQYRDQSDASMIIKFSDGRAWIDDSGRLMMACESGLPDQIDVAQVRPGDWVVNFGGNYGDTEDDFGIVKDNVIHEGYRPLEQIR